RMTWIAMTDAPQKATGIPWSGKVSFPAYTMLALTLVGIAVALYVAKGNYTGQPLWCPIIDGCNVVVNSPYSRIFGVPMAYFGFIYYLYIFALAARLAFDPFSNSLRFRAVLYAGVGARFLGYFLRSRSAAVSCRTRPWACANSPAQPLARVPRPMQGPPRQDGR